MPDLAPHAILTTCSFMSDPPTDYISGKCGSGYGIGTEKSCESIPAAAAGAAQSHTSQPRRLSNGKIIGGIPGGAMTQGEAWIPQFDLLTLMKLCGLRV
jgi:hypothetical protein